MRRLIKRSLGIGALEDPPTFLFILDTEELPGLEMPYGFFRPASGVRSCADAWLRAGGPHHQVLNPGLHADDWCIFCDAAGIELAVV